MASSLIKFIQETKDASGRGDIHWGRVGRDGLPYRGSVSSLKTEEEFEETNVRVSDPNNGTFNTSVPEENAQYLKILDGASNGWYSIIHIERWLDKPNNAMYAYVEWLVHFMEDGSRVIPD